MNRQQSRHAPDDPLRLAICTIWYFRYTTIPNIAYTNKAKHARDKNGSIKEQVFLLLMIR